MNTQTPHIVEIEKLELGEHLFDFQLDNSYFSTIEASELLGGDVDAKVRLIVGEDSVAVDVDVCGTVQVTCDRCLESRFCLIRFCRPLPLANFSLDAKTEPINS